MQDASVVLNEGFLGFLSHSCRHHVGADEGMSECQSMSVKV